MPLIRTSELNGKTVAAKKEPIKSPKYPSPVKLPIIASY